jgi:hypothetical protein
MQVFKRAAAAFVAAAFLFLGIGSLATAEAGAAAKAVGAHNYTAVWWNAPAGSQAGWGINFSHQGDIVFATWFTYDSDRKPQWFIALLDKSGERVYSGPVSRVTGPPFNSVPFPGGTSVETEVGNATVTFAEDGESATFAYTVNGVSQTKTIIRQLFAEPVPSCVWGEQTDLAGSTNYQGLWWTLGGAERGWGINFTHQGKVIFATWFTYDAAGKPWWLIVLADRTGPRTYAGPVFTVSGPGFDAEPWDPDTVVETEIGEAKITFADGNRATFEYTVNGVTQSKQIERQVFAPPGTVCAVPDQSAAYVASLYDLANRANTGAINDEQFVAEMTALLATIDGADGAAQRLKRYLETQVLGHAINFTIPAAAESGAATKALTTGQFDPIFASLAYRILEAAVSGTTFTGTPDASGSFIQATDVARLVALADIYSRIAILDARTSGTLPPDKAAQFLALIDSNAFEALRELYLQLALPIPAWLLPAPTTCLVNCVDVHRTYSGNPSGSGLLDISTPIVCKANVSFSGAVNFDLTIHPNNTVEGTVSVNGTVQVTQVLQTNSPFLCRTGPLPINSSGAITGTIDQMTATINVAGFPGIVVAHITGDTLLGQVQTPTGAVLLTFSLTRLP